MTCHPFRRLTLRRTFLLLPLAFLAAAVAFARADGPSADDLLSAARKAYHDADLPAAAAQYRAFLARFADRPEAPAVRLELARCLLQGPAPDGRGALDILRPLADRADAPQRPAVPFYLGAAARAAGSHELAAKRFGEAADAFAAVGEKDKDGPEWAFRARCWRAEALARAGKAAEARDAAAALLKDPRAAEGADRDLALYSHGAACFALKDNMAAGRSLDQLAPFADPTVGPAARRLLARVHERDDEREEALVDYEGVIADYTARKQEAAARLQAEADALAKDPAEKARLTAVAEGPPPDAVLEASFAAGVLHFEAGRFADARARFDALADAPRPALKADARLYRGCCEVRLLQFPQAVETLTPLTDGDPLTAAQALLWLARARAGAADPADPDAYPAALREAVETYGKADAALQAPVFRDGPDAAFARARRTEAALERAEVYERLGRFKEAADAYAAARAGKLPPAPDEAALQRELSARTLAGDYAAAEKLAKQFESAYPHSTLTPEATLRRAEAAALAAESAGKDEAMRLRAEAAKRFRQVIDKYPEFDHVSQARYGLAWVLYRTGELDAARAVLEEIPETDRKEDLAGAGYLLAECLIRTAPAKADDAVAAGKLQEQLTEAAGLLAAVGDGQPEAPCAPDALMRLGLCDLRLSAVAAQDDERNRLAGESRAAFDRVLLEYPLDETQPHAALERARWIVRAGDVNQGVLRLRPFGYGALQKHPLAPLACVELAGWMRQQDGKQAEAARLLARVRRDCDKALRADPARAAWATLLQYQQALALQDAGKYAEARAVLAELTKQTPDRPEAAEAKLVWGLSLLAEARQKIDAANQALGAPDLTASAAAEARRSLEEGRKGVRDAAQYLEEQARALGKEPPSPILQARLYYEAAWVLRGLADEQVAAEKARMQEEWRKKQPKPPEGQPAHEPPDYPLSDIPVQPAEKKTRELYRAVITAAPDLPFAAQARLELAELLSQRGDDAAAVTLLKEALDQEPPPELSGRVGLRLAACLQAKGDADAALRQLERVAGLADSPWAPHARYRAGALRAKRGEWDKAVETLAPFQTAEALQNLPGLTDAALLLIGQAHGAKERWEEGDTAYGKLLEGFADSAWRRHARYGLAWALHKQKKFPEAIEAYQRAYADAPPEVAVRSLIQIAACQVELKQDKEAVETLAGVGADFPDLHALALAEAGYAHARLGQRDEAAACWKQVLADYPKSPFAEEIKKRLDAKEVGPPPHDSPEAGRLLALPVQSPPPLDPLGGQQPPDQSAFEDRVEQACQDAVLARPLALRPAAAPSLRLAPPEPFEHRDVVRVRGLAALDDIPPTGPVPLPPP
jgi:tetratricopeptide (TPR) repeat protein